MSIPISDTALLAQFRSPITKEQAFTTIVKKYQEKLYWHIRRMVIHHEDANERTWKSGGVRQNALRRSRS